jgi:hypothetical protein
MGWTLRCSNPGGEESFCIRPGWLAPSQDPVRWVICCFTQNKAVGRGVPDLNRYIFVSGDIKILLFMLLKSAAFRSCSNEYRMELIRFVWHLEFFSMSGNYCSDVKHPVLKLEAGHLEHFLWFSGDLNSETMLQNAYVHKSFPLYCVDSPCVLWTYFFRSSCVGPRLFVLLLLNPLYSTLSQIIYKAA